MADDQGFEARGVRWSCGRSQQTTGRQLVEKRHSIKEKGRGVSRDVNRRQENHGKSR